VSYNTNLHRSQIPLVIERLKMHLKSQGLRRWEIAASVKRWLAGEGLTLKKLEDLCNLAQIEFLELMEISAGEAVEKIDHFTVSQERALSEDPVLFSVFWLLMDGYPVSECRQELRLSPKVMSNNIASLSRLGLLDALSKDRVRLRASRTVQWRRNGPLSKYFEPTSDFIDLKRKNDDTFYISDGLRLTQSGRAKVQDIFEKMHVDIIRIAELDKHHMNAGRQYYGMLFFLRTFTTDMIRAKLPANRLD